MPTLAQEVGTIPLFMDLSADERERLLKYALVDEYRPGYTLFHEGATVGQHMYVILSGEVEILKRDRTNKEAKLADLRRGHFFGEMSLFEKQTRSATAKVKSLSRILVITGSNFDDMMKSDPTIANKILLVFVRTLSQRLRNTNEKYVAETYRHPQPNGRSSDRGT